jgi:hypothetical protein
MSPSSSPNIAMLTSAGLINPEHLTRQDENVIDQLSEAEVSTLISIAQRLYAGNPSILKELNLKEGFIRLMVPL